VTIEGEIVLEVPGEGAIGGWRVAAGPEAIPDATSLDSCFGGDSWPADCCPWPPSRRSVST